MNRKSTTPRSATGMAPSHNRRFRAVLPTAAQAAADTAMRRQLADIYVQLPPEGKAKVLASIDRELKNYHADVTAAVAALSAQAARRTLPSCDGPLLRRLITHRAKVEHAIAKVPATVDNVPVARADDWRAGKHAGVHRHRSRRLPGIFTPGEDCRQRGNNEEKHRE